MTSASLGDEGPGEVGISPVHPDSQKLRRPRCGMDVGTELEEFLVRTREPWKEV